jgi:cell wall assembly regulator SMI1
MKFDPNRLNHWWQRYVAKATELHPPFPTYLDRGATEEEVAAAEREVGCDFPEDLRHLLRRHNGSLEYQALPGWELFSTARIASEWKTWEDLYRMEFKPGKVKCEPEGPIKGDEWWRLRWIPFTGDGGGNHLCVDMDPPFSGVKGQVITMWHDVRRREHISKSLTDFVEMIALDIEQGRLVWDEDWGSFQEPVE